MPDEYCDRVSAGETSISIIDSLKFRASYWHIISLPELITHARKPAAKSALLRGKCPTRSAFARHDDLMYNECSTGCGNVKPTRLK